MKLYTFQPNFIWETIQQDGYFHPFDLFEKNAGLIRGKPRYMRFLYTSFCRMGQSISPAFQAA